MKLLGFSTRLGAWSCLVLATLAAAACSGNDGSGTGGTGGNGGSGGTGGSGGAGGSGGTNTHGPFRAGPERLMATEHGLEGGYPPRALRCPAGSFLTGINIAHPDQQIPESAERLRLVCAPLDDQGILGANAVIENNINIPAELVFTTIACPAGQVATRILGSYDENVNTAHTFTSLGLACHEPGTFADGAPGGTSTPSEPSSFGSPSPMTFDDACPSGAGLAGLVLRHTVLFGTDQAAGFDALRGLCRDVLRDTVPGGGPWDPEKPFKLGPVVPEAPISLTSWPLPSESTKQTRDCPDGSVVTSIDGGKTPIAGPTSLSDIQLTCRPLGTQAELGAPVDVGGAMSPIKAPCLDGAAVQALHFTKAAASQPGLPDTSANVGADCTLPIDTLTPATQSLPAWAPGYEENSAEPWLTAACPEGAVLTGVDLWGPFPNGDGALGGVGARCRTVTR